MNLINIKEVMQQTDFSEDEIRDLVSKDLFPEHFGIVDDQVHWQQDAIRIWLKVHGH